MKGFSQGQADMAALLKKALEHPRAAEDEEEDDAGPDRKRRKQSPRTAFAVDHDLVRSFVTDVSVRCLCFLFTLSC